MTANILTVDDSASIRLTTNVTLTSAGYSVTEAVNGAEGIAEGRGRQLRPDRHRSQHAGHGRPDDDPRTAQDPGAIRACRSSS